MAKKTYTTQSVETYALLDRLERQLTDLFGSTYEGALKIAAVRKAIAAGESFTFDENRPETKQLIKSLSVMAGKADRLLADSVKLAWKEGEESVTNACYSAFGSMKDSKEAVRAIADRSREDLRKRGVSASAFYNRQHGGLTISDRVWNIAQSGKSEIEEIIQQGVLQGKSAAEISRSVRSYLRNPNKLFRRVRNKETGELELSRNARSYHPGRGVYRSSCQNAMRLARTEVNAAYRRAEWESYQNNPLITGYRIQLSNNHTIKIKGKAVAFHDICDELAGDYPKTFQWTGWHPQCRCRMIPIFLTEGDFRARIRALAAGKLDTWKAGNTVTQLPEAFTGWVKANTDRIKSAKQVPFFILDNYKGGDPTKGLVDTITSLKQQVKESAKVQPVTEYDGELANLEKWSATFELDTTQARILREEGDKAGLKKEIERLQDLKDERSTEWLTARTRLRIFADKLKEYPEYSKYDNILQQYEIKPQGPTWKEAVQKLKDAANQARADFDKRLKEKEAEKQKAQAAAAAAQKAAEASDRLPDIEYKTATDIEKGLNAVNAGLVGKSWAQNSASFTLAETRRPGQNGSTNMEGSIKLTPQRMKLCISAFEKIRTGKSETITKQEADAMGTLWHEITHNRHKNQGDEFATTKLQDKFMELANEFTARKSLPEFYKALGAKGNPIEEFETSRSSTGYNQMVINYDQIIDALKLDRSAVTAAVREGLFYGNYGSQKTELAKALLKGGIKLASGKDPSIKTIEGLISRIANARGGYYFTEEGYVYRSASEEVEMIMKEKKFIR